MKTGGGESWRRTGCYGLQQGICTWDLLMLRRNRSFYVCEREGGDGLTFLLLLFTGGCAIFDLKKRRIPNRLLVIGGILIVLWRFSLGMDEGYRLGVGDMPPGEMAAFLVGLWQGGSAVLLAGGAVLALFPLYLFRMMGAGDIKLAALIWGGAGLWRGAHILEMGLAAAGIVSVYLLFRRGIASSRIRYLGAYLNRCFWQSVPEPYYLEERDGKIASFCLAPCLFLGVLGELLMRWL